MLGRTRWRRGDFEFIDSPAKTETADVAYLVAINTFTTQTLPGDSANKLADVLLCHLIPVTDRLGVEKA